MRCSKRAHARRSVRVAHELQSPPHPMPFRSGQQTLLARLLGRVQQTLGLDASATLQDRVGHRLRRQALVEGRAHLLLHMGQLNERRKLGTSSSGDGHLDLSRVHVSESEQGQHRLAVKVRPVARAQQRLGELVVGSRRHVRHPVQPVGDILQATARRELG